MNMTCHHRRIITAALAAARHELDAAQSNIKDTVSQNGNDAALLSAIGRLGVAVDAARTVAS